MKATLRVLSVGSEESVRTTYGALFGRREYELITATTYRELFAIPAHECIRIAVLNHTLSREELAAAARLIRRRLADQPGSSGALQKRHPSTTRSTMIVSRQGCPRRLLFTAIDRLVDGHQQQLSRRVRSWER